MQLAWVRLVGLGPFQDVEFPFRDDQGGPRPLTLVYGGGGVGKTTLLNALAVTRPGHASVPSQSPVDGAEIKSGGEPPHAVCDWLLGADDTERPHPLRVATPNARIFPDEERETLRRREQNLFDRVARDGGFAFLSIPGSRWFSRQPLGFSAPLRSIARYDVRGPMGVEDASRSDLTRDTKQALAYAAIAAALARTQSSGRPGLTELGGAMTGAVNALVELAGYRYMGLDAASFEPQFEAPNGRHVPFDLLPTRVRHLTCFAALPVRTLWAAYPDRDPRTSEAVVTIDEVDLHLDPGLATGVPPALRRALPNVQWILTTASAALAGSTDARDVLALRRVPEADHVELFTGEEARVH
jgi:hypothetical protein